MREAGGADVGRSGRVKGLSKPRLSGCTPNDQESRAELLHRQGIAASPRAKANYVGLKLEPRPADQGPTSLCTQLIPAFIVSPFIKEPVPVILLPFQKPFRFENHNGYSNELDPVQS
jgi:hypothetical protein